jgi:hypothetical protein
MHGLGRKSGLKDSIMLQPTDSSKPRSRTLLDGSIEFGLQYQREADKTNQASIDCIEELTKYMQVLMDQNLKLKKNLTLLKGQIETSTMTSHSQLEALDGLLKEEDGAIAVKERTIASIDDEKTLKLKTIASQNERIALLNAQYRMENSCLIQ